MVLVYFFLFTLLVELEFHQEVIKGGHGISGIKSPKQEAAQPSKSSDPITIFMCGDVMTGRGIDQLLLHPSDPIIHEPYLKNAGIYVELGCVIIFGFKFIITQSCIYLSQRMLQNY